MWKKRILLDELYFVENEIIKMKIVYYSGQRFYFYKGCLKY